MIRYPAIILVILTTAALVEPMPQSRVRAARPKESLAIIVNRENPIESLSMAELRSNGGLAFLNRMKAEQTDFKYDIEWRTLGGYLYFLQRKGVSQNVASFLGATTVRE